MQADKRPSLRRSDESDCKFTDLSAQITELELNLSKLPPRDKVFASSLISQFARKQALTPGQIPWVAKLLKIAGGESTGSQVAVKVGDFDGVLELFRAAREHLRNPKIHLLVGKAPVRLTIAGEKSKAPGSVVCTSEGGFYDRKFYGRVTPEGDVWSVVPGSRMTSSRKNWSRF